MTFVATNKSYRDKHTFVATKDVFCRDKNVFVATNKITRACRDRTFVATKIILVATPANNTSQSGFSSLAINSKTK